MKGFSNISRFSALHDTCLRAHVVFAAALVDADFVGCLRQRRCVTHAVAPKSLPWGTHAYIIGAELAERLLLLGEYIISRSRLNNEDKSAWVLDGDDIKIDHFINNYYNRMLPKEERSKCALIWPPVCNILHQGRLDLYHALATRLCFKQALVVVCICMLLYLSTS